MFDDLIPQSQTEDTPFQPQQPQPQSQSPFANAISSVESGGRYDITGPVTRNGDRAYGKYQVMGANIGPWSREVFGRPLSVQEFVSNPQAQDAVFNAKFGEYARKYGPEGAAKAWFAGEGGMNNPNARDMLGTTVAGYANKFNRALGPQTQAMGFAPEQQTGQDITVRAPSGSQPRSDAPFSFDDLIPQQQTQSFDQRFQQPGNPQNAPAMQSGLRRQADQMTTGQQLSPTAQTAIEGRNLLSGALQGTVPHADQYGGKLISAETQTSDSGDVMYRDPATGEVRPTDQKTQVALRDPRDGTIKVYERSAATDEGGLTGAARVLAPGLAAGAVTARPAIPAAKIVPKASDIFSTAKAPYREFSNIAGKIEVPKQTATDFAGRLRGALDKVNLDVEMAGKPASAAVRMLESPTEPMTLDYLQRVKRFASRGFSSAEKDVRDGAAAITREIGKIIQEVSPEAGAALKEADAIHSTALSVQNLQRKSDIANLRTGRAGYGGNAVNNMRSQIEKIVEADVLGKKTGFKPDEIQAMRDISNGNWLTNASRLVGGASPSKGGFQIAMGISTGGVTAAIGSASNKLATILTGKQIDRLKELVAQRSPAYAQAVAKATERYERAQMELVNNPSAKKFGAYMLASRALSAGLQKDGIQISSGDLIRQLQGPVKAAADDANPEPVRGVNQ